MDDQEFRNLVKREIHTNGITEEERAYLWSSEEVISRWKVVLSDLYEESMEGKKARKAEMDARYEVFAREWGDVDHLKEWVEYRRKQTKAINQALAYQRKIEARKTAIRMFIGKRYKGDLAFTQRVNEVMLTNTYQLGIATGWYHALEHIQRHIEEGMTPAQAILACEDAYDTHYARTLEQADPALAQLEQETVWPDEVTGEEQKENEGLVI